MTQFAITNEVHKTLEIKKSQFICWLKTVDSREDAMAFLAIAKQTYPDARHHCWAYIMGANAQSQTAAMSDDGEPSGTAGKPILNVLQHKPVNNIMAIVIRYFGGIKLGAGGLVRAYSQSVEQAFGEAELAPIVPVDSFTAKFDFAQEQWVRHQLDLLNGTILDVEYAESVTMTGLIPSEGLQQLQNAIASKSIDLVIDE
ncbi:YigZ family protein [Psychrosphaera sp. B3R10]|uniref:YigZ family protein n=1 Tax=unclassified Psychrosphaera TaxID=2641570 RepID=UPI001C09F11D|nr:MULTISPECIES: YigZ family protein [unclassified Psychrosphaera]MBU2883635.1 YigZ family protein [Psychrosphaera sp. I2R16]MBU2989813.1 YigZ family protein [Psychrosphaera sp. B3R10]